MAAAVVWIIVRYGRVVACVVVPDEIITIRNQVSFTEATSESGVEIVNTSVNDGNLDTGASITSGAELIDLGLDMGGEGVLSAVILALPESISSLLRGDAGASDDLLLDRNVDAADWPYRLDSSQGDNLVYRLFFINKVFELERGALEEAVAEVQTFGELDILSTEAIIERTDVLASFVRHLSSLVEAVLLLREILQTRPCRRQE